MTDPHRNEGDEGSSPDVNVFWEQSREIDAACDSIATDILEECCRHESQSQEEHSGACFGRALTVVHDEQEQVRWIPFDLSAIYDLTSRGDDQTYETDQCPDNPG